MKFIRIAGSILLLCSASFTVQAQQATPEAAERARSTQRPDTPGSGPYPALKEVDPALPHHVLYRPANLNKLKGRKLGILLWGSGGCSNDAASARFHLAEIASHGYVAVAPGKILSGPDAPPRQPRPSSLDSNFFADMTTPADMLRGLDWLLAENRRKGSNYFGRIDPRLIAVSGHSCGGLEAIELGTDPRVRTVVVHNSGTFPGEKSSIPKLTITKATLGRLHTPIIYILGGAKDIAWPNGTDDFARIGRVPAALVTADVGHGGTFDEPNGGRAATIALAWLDWQLRGDRKAARTFRGADCGLCADPTWKIQRKKID
jgi:acetyl esterase/lipase